MPMQPVQIANSGVTPGRYGNNKQIPVFNVDQRGRLTFAANVDIEPALNIRVNDVQNSTLNLNTDVVKFQSGDGISVRIDEQGSLEFSLDRLYVNQLLDDLGINNPIIRNIESLDGTVLVNVMSKKVTGIVESSNAIFNNIGMDIPAIHIETDSTEAGLLIKGPAENLFNGPHINLVSYNHENLSDNPNSAKIGDCLGQIRFSTETGVNNQIAPSAIITSVLESIGDNQNSFNNSDLRLICLDGGNTNNLYQAKLSRRTGFTAPAITPGSYNDSAHRDAAIPNPIPGMMIYLESTSKFQGYVGGNSPGWVDLN